MKNWLLSIVIALVLYSNMECCQSGPEEDMYDYQSTSRQDSSSAIYSLDRIDFTPNQRPSNDLITVGALTSAMAGTSISLMECNGTGFIYRVSYLTNGRRGLYNKIVRLQSSFGIPVNIDKPFTLHSLIGQQPISFSKGITVEEKECNIPIFNFVLDAKKDQAIYANNSPVWLQTAPQVSIIPQLVIFMGKCSQEGKIIYKVYHDQSQRLPNPCLLFAKKFLYKSCCHLGLSSRNSLTSYFMSLLNLNVRIADTKKYSMIKWFLQQYMNQNKNIKGLYDIVSYIMDFVDQTCLIES